MGSYLDVGDDNNYRSTSNISSVAFLSSLTTDTKNPCDQT